MVSEMEEKKKTIAVIGGGASGILCSILLKQALKDVNVIIFERQERIGKKILQTGNGRCNLSNNSISWKDYNTCGVDGVLQQFTPKKCKEVFTSLGLWLDEDNEGRIYPYSYRAQTVLDVLLEKIKELEIEVITNFNVLEIKALDDFSIYSTDLRLYHADYVIMATGGLASINKNDNKCFNSYEILKSLGHHIIEPIAGLCALKTKEKTKSLSGLRMKVKASIINNNEKHTSYGEVLFKDEGLSGIVIFDLSRFYRHNEHSIIELDFFPTYTEEEIKQKIGTRPLKLALCGCLPKMIVQDVLTRSKNKTIEEIIFLLKHYTYTITQSYGFANAQITMGGVLFNEVNPFTMQSLLIKKLYLIGEVLDVDGKCGGYNLHFAWASAYVAANDIIKNFN